ncbi:MAG: hypothetical protein K8R02_04265 [Anaerohalosphaeraceae bacterium]|nr:hypothetical protein [Anaerohalosphaeraceae bacterium]
MKKKAKRIYISGAIVSVVAVIFFAVWLFGLFSEPKYYKPIKPINQENVSLYLSNYLIPELHNKSQYDEPFNYIVTQDGVNDVVARHSDFEKISAAGFSDIAVAFVADEILLMGKAEHMGIEMLFAAAIEPAINDQGKLFLKSQGVRIGKSRIPFASGIVRKKLLENLDSICSEPNAAKTIRAIAQGEVIEPVFKIDGNKIRAEKITIKDGALIIRFVKQ